MTFLTEEGKKAIDTAARIISDVFYYGILAVLAFLLIFTLGQFHMMQPDSLEWWKHLGKMGWLAAGFFALLWLLHVRREEDEDDE